MFQKGGDENSGDSKRMYVANDDNGKLQSLLMFDLAFVAKSFGPVLGVAPLSVYLASGSHSGGG